MINDCDGDGCDGDDWGIVMDLNEFIGNWEYKIFFDKEKYCNMYKIYKKNVIFDFDLRFVKLSRY